MKKIIFFLTIFLLISFKSYSNELSIVDITFLLTNSDKGKKIQKELDNLNSKQKKNFWKKTTRSKNKRE